MKNIFKNSYYMIKKAWKIEKKYVLVVVLKNFFWILINLIAPLVLSVPIYLLENNYEVKTIIIYSFIACATTCIIQGLKSLAESKYMLYEEKLINKMQRTLYLESLENDYELFECSSNQELFVKASRVCGYNGAFTCYIENLIGMITHFIVFLLMGTFLVFINIYLLIGIIILAIAKFIFGSLKMKVEKKDRDRIIPFRRKFNYIDNVAKNVAIVKDLKIYEMDKMLNKKHDQTVDLYQKSVKKFYISRYKFAIILLIVEYLEEFFLYFFVGLSVLNKSIDIATFTYSISTVFNLSFAISSIINCINYLKYQSLELKDYKQYIDTMFRRNDAKQDVTFDNVKIEVKHLYYKYLNSQNYVLKDINFTIDKGEKISIVGENGAGKTTLVKLLLGLYHATEGEILINGININNISRKSLNNIFSPLFQEEGLYSLNVKEEITLNDRNDIDVNKINKLLELLNADNLFTSKPNGLDTKIGQNIFPDAIELSGGEKQKLLICRCMYKDSFIVIMDEPTSNLDAFTEKAIYDNFNKMLNNRSCLFISHRLSSCKLSDKIIVLNKGVIIEQGTHEELMNRNNEYAHMFSTQSELYKLEG